MPTSPRAVFGLASLRRARRSVQGMAVVATLVVAMPAVQASQWLGTVNTD